MSKNNKKGFPLEKILSISATDYFTIKGKDPSKYNTIGINVEDMEPKELLSDFKPKIAVKEKFSRQIPVNTEVVVEYSASLNVAIGTNLNPADTGARKQVAFISYIAEGTALIPK